MTDEQQANKVLERAACWRDRKLPRPPKTLAELEKEVHEMNGMIISAWIAIFFLLVVITVRT